MKNILEEIYQHKILEVRNRKKQLSTQQICAQIKCSENKPQDFFAILKSKSESELPALICEIKKASPSHGLIRQDFNPIEIAKIYQNNGAAAISVLTDEKYFQGSNQYLQDVRVNTTLPILRKEFMLDVYQVYEAKMLGADCILLIVAMLDDDKLIELEQAAIDSGLSVLVEIHNEQELQRASKLKSKMIGINNRDLKTLKVDLETSLFLAEQIPSDYLTISESGIKDKLDIALLQQAGINCFLIGESLMKEKDIVKALQELQK